MEIKGYSFPSSFFVMLFFQRNNDLLSWEFIIHQCTLLVKQYKSILTSYIPFVILTCTVFKTL